MSINAKQSLKGTLNVSAGWSSTDVPVITLTDAYNPSRGNGVEITVKQGASIETMTVWDGRNGTSAYASVKEENGVVTITTQDASGIDEVKIPIFDFPQTGSFRTDETLNLEDGVLSVNTTDLAEQDNTLPITSAGVYATVGNIEALLKTI